MSGVTNLAPSVGVAIAAFLAGAIPFSNIAARRRAGVDLRDVGTGTVSGTSLFRVAGFGALAIAGIAEVAKGDVRPAARGARHRARGGVRRPRSCGPQLVTVPAGAGGRGVAPALGALLVVAWPGAVVLIAGLVLGRVAHQTGFGSFVALVVLTPVTAFTSGAVGALAGICVVVPMFAKRMLGNRPPARSRRPFLPAAVAVRSGRHRRSRRSRDRVGRSRVSVSVLWRRTGYRTMLVGQAVSALGDWMGTIAFMALVLEQSGSSTAVGGILALRLLPGAIGGPLAAAPASRWDRRRVMVAMDVVRAGIVILVPLVNQLWWIYLWAFTIEVASLVFLPARDASIPDLVDNDDLPLANGLVLGTSYGTIPLGAALFALVTALPGHDLLGRPFLLVFWLDAASFVVSALLIARLTQLLARNARTRGRWRGHRR